MTSPSASRLTLPLSAACLALAACSGGGVDATQGPPPRAAQSVFFLTEDLLELRGVTDTGSAERVLASATNTAILDFELSPDGGALAFLADNDLAGRFDLYVVEVSGGPAQRVSQLSSANQDVADFRWSPNSQRLAYRADVEIDGQELLFAVRRGGSAHYRVHGLFGSTTEIDQEYRWSPDSRWLALAYYSTSTGNTTRLLSHDASTEAEGTTTLISGPLSKDLADIRFSPDGQWVAARTDFQAADGQYEVFRVAPDGSTAPLRSNGAVGGTASISEYDWAPGSQYLAQHVVAYPAGTSIGINSYHLPTETSVRLLSSEVIGDLAWSPTRDELALVAADDLGGGDFGPRTLRVIDAETEVARVVSAPLQGSEEVAAKTGLWSPNGNRLAYVTRDAAGLERLYRAPVQAGGTAIRAQDLEGHGPVALAWSPDSSLLGVLDRDQNTAFHPSEWHLVNAAGASTWRSGQVFAFAASQELRWSPDSVWAMVATPDMPEGPNRVRGVVRNGSGERPLSQVPMSPPQGLATGVRGL